MKVAICIDKSSTIHSTNWCFPWEEYCVENNLNFEVLNPYSSNIIEQLNGFDVLLWHFSGYIYTDMLIARNILYSAKSMGMKIFPDINDSWHFDDKVAETYLLQSIKAPLPISFLFYSIEELNKFASNSKYPIIAKLRNGSGSHNVKLIKDKKTLLSYGNTMFNKGLNSSPSLLYKASSNAKSSKSIQTFVKRLKRLPEFLKTLSQSKQFAYERGYVYLQEFIPNDGYDLKVVVIADKLSFIGRNIRKGDFRASGGGSLFYDKEIITKDIIDSAFETSDRLGFKCMGYDYVVNSETKKGYIVEISYGFSHNALLDAGGYFTRQGEWIDIPLNAPKELLANLLNE